MSELKELMWQNELWNAIEYMEKQGKSKTEINDFVKRAKANKDNFDYLGLSLRRR